jgi:hypothetical protein
LVSDRVGCIGAQDTAQPGRNAIVFPCGDTERLAQAVELLHKDGDLYARMSAHSLRVSESQDELAAAQRTASAACLLSNLGPRGHTSRNRRQVSSEVAAT